MSIPEEVRPTMVDRLTSRFLPWRIESPVFVIAPPRSGSTLLFECLAQFKELTAFTHREGTFIWARVLPYEKRSTVSDAITPAEFGNWRRRQVKLLFYATSIFKSPNLHGYDRIRRLIRHPHIRYLDKTIANAFQLDLIEEMFPDATFVFLVRNPRANLTSMLNSWSDEEFQKPKLTRHLRQAGSALSQWTYAAPPGWQETVHWPLPDICAWMWQKHVEAILRFRSARNAGPLVRYEDLVSDPLSVVGNLAAHLELEVTDEIIS